MSSEYFLIVKKPFLAKPGLMAWDSLKRFVFKTKNLMCVLVQSQTQSFMNVTLLLNCYFVITNSSLSAITNTSSLLHHY